MAPLPPIDFSDKPKGDAYSFCSLFFGRGVGVRIGVSSFVEATSSKEDDRVPQNFFAERPPTAPLRSLSAEADKKRGASQKEDDRVPQNFFAERPPTAPLRSPSAKRIKRETFSKRRREFRHDLRGFFPSATERRFCIKQKIPPTSCKRFYSRV